MHSRELTAAHPLPAALRPSRVSVWLIDDRRYGLDLTYHGPTGYRDAENLQAMFDAKNHRSTFRQELDGAWTVRLGPVPATIARQLVELMIP